MSSTTLTTYFIESRLDTRDAFRPKPISQQVSIGVKKKVRELPSYLPEVLKLSNKVKEITDNSSNGPGKADEKSSLSDKQKLIEKKKLAKLEAKKKLKEEEKAARMKAKKEEKKKSKSKKAKVKKEGSESSSSSSDSSDDSDSDSDIDDSDSNIDDDDDDKKDSLSNISVSDSSDSSDSETEAGNTNNGPKPTKPTINDFKKARFNAMDRASKDVSALNQLLGCAVESWYLFKVAPGINMRDLEGCKMRIFGDSDENPSNDSSDKDCTSGLLPLVNSSLNQRAVFVKIPENLTEDSTSSSSSSNTKKTNDNGDDDEETQIKGPPSKKAKKEKTGQDKDKDKNQALNLNISESGIVPITAESLDHIARQYSVLIGPASEKIAKRYAPPSATVDKNGRSKKSSSGRNNFYPQRIQKYLSIQPDLLSECGLGAWGSMSGSEFLKRQDIILAGSTDDNYQIDEDHENCNTNMDNIDSDDENKKLEKRVEQQLDDDPDLDPQLECNLDSEALALKRRAKKEELMGVSKAKNLGRLKGPVKAIKAEPKSDDKNESSTNSNTVTTKGPSNTNHYHKTAISLEDTNIDIDTHGGILNPYPIIKKSNPDSNNSNSNSSNWLTLDLTYIYNTGEIDQNILTVARSVLPLSTVESEASNAMMFGSTTFKKYDIESGKERMLLGYPQSTNDPTDGTYNNDDDDDRIAYRSVITGSQIFVADNATPNSNSISNISQFYLGAKISSNSNSSNQNTSKLYLFNVEHHTITPCDSEFETMMRSQVAVASSEYKDRQIAYMDFNERFSAAKRLRKLKNNQGKIIDDTNIEGDLQEITDRIAEEAALSNSQNESGAANFLGASAALQQAMKVVPKWTNTPRSPKHIFEEGLKLAFPMDLIKNKIKFTDSKTALLEATRLSADGSSSMAGCIENRLFKAIWKSSSDSSSSGGSKSSNKGSAVMPPDGVLKALCGSLLAYDYIRLHITEKKIRSKEDAVYHVKVAGLLFVLLCMFNDRRFHHSGSREDVKRKFHDFEPETQAENANRDSKGKGKDSEGGKKGSSITSRVLTLIPSTQNTIDSSTNQPIIPHAFYLDNRMKDHLVNTYYDLTTFADSTYSQINGEQLNSETCKLNKHKLALHILTFIMYSDPRSSDNGELNLDSWNSDSGLLAQGKAQQVTYQFLQYLGCKMVGWPASSAKLPEKFLAPGSQEKDEYMKEMMANGKGGPGGKMMGKGGKYKGSGMKGKGGGGKGKGIKKGKGKA